MTRITVASGKGGTGKTTVATSLALSLAADMRNPCPPLFLDCDVEAPNAHLFLSPVFEQRQEVNILIPVVDEALCTYCGKCAEVCQYYAIAVLGKKTLVFPQLCHGCGSCMAMCPEKAISEAPKRIGMVERGQVPASAGYGPIEYGRGVLDVGEPMAVPIIRQLKSWVAARDGQTVILDASPGTSCPVVAAVQGADFLLLVTEPTPFGLHDLRLAAQIAGELRIPAGVVINRYTGDFPEMEAFCQAQALPVLMRIPFERAIAEGVARGQSLVHIHAEYIQRFQEMYRRILAILGQEKTP